MYILDDLYKRDLIFSANSDDELLKHVNFITNNNVKSSSFKNSVKAIRNEWDDTTQVILDHTMFRMEGDNHSLIEKYEGVK